MENTSLTRRSYCRGAERQTADTHTLTQIDIWLSDILFKEDDYRSYDK